MRALQLLVVTAFAVLVPAAAAGQSPVAVSTELSFWSRYHFAGIPFSTGEVTQAHLRVGAGGLTLNGFATWDHDLGEPSEADVYGDYYLQVAPTVGVYVGGALYNFKIGDAFEPTPELYGGVVLGVPLSPTLHIAHDFDLGDGTRIALSVAREVPLGTSGLTLGVGANLDYNDSYWEQYWQVNGEDSGFTFAALTASLGVPVGPVVVTPRMLLQRAIHEDFLDEELFGVSARFTF